jgi:hypothetical protein
MTGQGSARQHSGARSRYAAAAKTAALMLSPTARATDGSAFPACR